jgi:hypothetical protein
MVNHESLVDLNLSSQIDQVLAYFLTRDFRPVTQKLRETTCLKADIATLKYFPFQPAASAS